MGQVGRIGKECEDQFHRKRNPLASLESLGHEFDGNWRGDQARLGELPRIS
jgi:hypothetical protein